MFWILLLIIIAILTPILIYSLIQKKYYEFVQKNSNAIKKIIDYNKDYHFDSFECPEYRHDYDNEKMYENVSCYDYLIYQLQFPKERTALLDLINKANYNKKLYDEYLKGLNDIKYGLFDEDPQKLKLDKLITIEKKLVQKYYFHPKTRFKVNVYLLYINMGGRLMSKKHREFDEYSVCHAVDLLNDKNGRFYNNRDVWDALCRVERAKVSNKMRFSIYARDNYRCQICHRKFSPDELEIDHIYPVSKGGKSTYDNLQSLCKRCNKLKGNTVINKNK